MIYLRTILEVNIDSLKPGLHFCFWDFIIVGWQQSIFIELILLYHSAGGLLLILLCFSIARGRNPALHAAAALISAFFLRNKADIRMASALHAAAECTHA